MGAGLDCLEEMAGDGGIAAALSTFRTSIFDFLLSMRSLSGSRNRRSSDYRGEGTRRFSKYSDSNEEIEMALGGRGDVACG
ncbi:hypothetical protein GW17_00008638 [Ensete ventricosum]|uniref:Uncharacterized protein n=1 Tax=Ensete ventricosum TaxID=4639 RepID=A0A426ZZQ0_ENSVE|nr:hypothetical protein B296_00037376 [Ensete ventricosum]RWW26956.1 hypothetical protein GW17_00008638 [Ensete ventricosum]